MESDFESKSRCASLRPTAMATGNGWGVEGSRGTLEGYITLLVQNNPHTHTPLTYHLHTPTSLTSSPPPLTYTLTPSPPSLTPPLEGSRSTVEGHICYTTTSAHTLTLHYTRIPSSHSHQPHILTPSPLPLTPLPYTHPTHTYICAYVSLPKQHPKLTLTHVAPALQYNYHPTNCYLLVGRMIRTSIQTQYP